MNETLLKSLPSMPMTGTGAEPPQEQEQDPLQLLQSYIVPARPSTLNAESEPGASTFMKIARRRLSPSSGLRRL